MLNIYDQKDNTLYYECDCGSKGMCTIKPVNKKGAAIVIDIVCNSCMYAERLTMVQYDDEKSKQEIMCDLNNIDLSWVPTYNEEV